MPHGTTHGTSHGTVHGTSHGSVPLSYTVVASGGAAGTSVTFAAHQTGDVIVVAARQGNTTPPTVPSAGGTVPTWNTIESGGANSLSLVTVWTTATADTTTSGTFTGAGQMIYTILRFNRTVTLGAHSTGNASTTETIVFPALTRDTADGTCFRTGTRSAADSMMSDAPTGWTNLRVQPTGASATTCIHSQDSASSNPTLDTVNLPGTPAAYRAHTFEFKG